MGHRERVVKLCLLQCSVCSYFYVQGTWIATPRTINDTGDCHILGNLRICNFFSAVLTDMDDFEFHPRFVNIAHLAP